MWPGNLQPLRHIFPVPDQLSMDNSVKRSRAGRDSVFANRLQVALAGFGLSAPVITFLIAISPLDAAAKIALLVALSFVYFLICAWTLWQIRNSASVNERLEIGDKDRAALSDDDEWWADPDGDWDEKIASIEEVSEFFGSSLRPADMFRLIASRLNEIVPFSAVVLLIPSADRKNLITRNAFGSNALLLENAKLPIDSTAAGGAFSTGQIAHLADLAGDGVHFPDGAISGLVSSVSVPLWGEGEIFGVLQFFFSERPPENDQVLEYFRAIGVRLGHLLLGSLAYEKSLSSALTDPLTKLPNERAFYLVLENQLAESQRFRDERPLTVLAVDIVDFDEINRKYGHSTGDRMLGFVAEGISSQLRRMDFLARSLNDEFLIILPKASGRTVSEIIHRISKYFDENAFNLADSEASNIWLSFGRATFWKDGEGVEDLVNTARQRKQLSKLEAPPKVLKFPKEYLN